MAITLACTVMIGTASAFSPSYPVFLVGRFSVPFSYLSVFRGIFLRLHGPWLRNSNVLLDDGACGRQSEDHPGGRSSLQLWLLGPHDSCDCLLCP